MRCLKFGKEKLKAKQLLKARKQLFHLLGNN